MALDLACPSTINTKQILANPIPGWETALPDPSKGKLEEAGRLYSAYFLEGPPSHNYGLLPDIESHKNGKDLSTWRFEDSSKIWLYCDYLSANLKLAKRLPASIKSCTIISYMKKRIHIESISCK
jgi:hypothetical protein